MTLQELHLFAGIGGGILGGMLLGHRCVGAVELDRYCRRVLEARQRDGILPPFPIHDDITTFDATRWRGCVDVVAGGFPCQDISSAGKREGLDGSRSSLWWEMVRVVREVAPRYVFVENVAALLVRGFDRVLGSLAELGFDAEWVVRSAADCGAPHLRRRLWLLAAHPDREGVHQRDDLQSFEPSGAAAPRTGHDGQTATVADADGQRQRAERQQESEGQQATWGDFADRRGEVRQQQHATLADTGSARLPAPEQEEPRGTRSRQEGQAAAERGWWRAEPRVGRVAHGVPARVDQLRALGNAQVPVVAATAFRELMARFST